MKPVELDFVAPGKWVTTDGQFGVIKKFKPLNPMETRTLLGKNSKHVFSIRDLRERTYHGIYYELSPEINFVNRFKDIIPWLKSYLSPQNS